MASGYFEAPSQEAEGEPVTAAGDSFVVHLDREIAWTVLTGAAADT